MTNKEIIKILRELTNNYVTINNTSVVKLYDLTKKINDLEREDLIKKKLMKNIN